MPCRAMRLWEEGTVAHSEATGCPNLTLMPAILSVIHSIARHYFEVQNHIISASSEDVTI